MEECFLLKKKNTLLYYIRGTPILSAPSMNQNETVLLRWKDNLAQNSLFFTCISRFWNIFNRVVMFWSRFTPYFTTFSSPSLSYKALNFSSWITQLISSNYFGMALFCPNISSSINLSFIFLLWYMVLKWLISLCFIL